MRGLLVLVFIALFLVQFSECFQVGMRVLLLAPSDDDATANLARLALIARGIPFDSVTLPTANAFSLLDASNNPRYCGIIITDRFMGATGPSRTSALNNAQLAQLEEYESQYGVPEVVLNAYPSTACGTALANGQTAGTGNFQVDQTALGQQFSSGVSQRIPLFGTWRAPAVISDSQLSSAAANLLSADGNSVLGVGIAICTFHSGQQIQHRRMEFYFSLAQFDVVSHAYANMWVQFVTHGVYFGQRRVHLSAQIDDVYMGSYMWSIEEHREVADTVRTSQSDWTELVQWQDSYRQTVMPSGSNFTIEMYFNGVGGVGTYDNGQLLYWTQQYIDKFLWGTHTWDHPFLTSLTLEQVNSQLDRNIVFARTYLGSEGQHAAVWDGTSIVTPSISGLHNPAALQSMLERGIMCASGDTSVENLTPTNPYHGRWATSYTSPQGQQVLIVPRAPTIIDYNSWNGSQVADQYNYLYGSGQVLTFEEILQLEASITLGFMSALDWREYMFHQANLLRTVEGSRVGSLVQLWVESVVEAYNTYFTLPIRTLGQSNLARQYIRRMQRDACFAANSIDGYFTVADDRSRIQGVTVTSSCSTTDAFVTLPAAAGGGFAGFSDTYGSDRTLYIPAGTTAVAVDIVWGGAGAGAVVSPTPVVTTPISTTASPSTTAAAVTTTVAQSTQAATVAPTTVAQTTVITTDTQQQQQPTSTSKQVSNSPSSSAAQTPQQSTTKQGTTSKPTSSQPSLTLEPNAAPTRSANHLMTTMAIALLLVFLFVAC